MPTYWRRWPTRSALDGAQLVDQTATAAIKDELRAINDEAVAAGVIGVPSVWVGGEVFWGDDRLDEAGAAVTASEA